MRLALAEAAAAAAHGDVPVGAVLLGPGGDVVAAAGWQNGEATILSCLIGIIVCAVLVVLVFAHRSSIRASVALLALGAIATSIGWLVPDSFGLVAMGPPA